MKTDQSILVAVATAATTLKKKIVSDRSGIRGNNTLEKTTELDPLRDAIKVALKHSNSDLVTKELTQVGIFDDIPFANIPGIFNDITFANTLGKVYGYYKGSEEILTVGLKNKSLASTDSSDENTAANALLKTFLEQQLQTLRQKHIQEQLQALVKSIQYNIEDPNINQLTVTFLNAAAVSFNDQFGDDRGVVINRQIAALNLSQLTCLEKAIDADKRQDAALQNIEATKKHFLEVLRVILARTVFKRLSATANITASCNPDKLATANATHTSILNALTAAYNLLKQGGVTGINLPTLPTLTADDHTTNANALIAAAAAIRDNARDITNPQITVLLGANADAIAAIENESFNLDAQNLIPARAAFERLSATADNTASCKTAELATANATHTNILNALTAADKLLKQGGVTGINLPTLTADDHTTNANALIAAAAAIRDNARDITNPQITVLLGANADAIAAIDIKVARIKLARMSGSPEDKIGEFLTELGSKIAFLKFYNNSREVIEQITKDHLGKIDKANFVDPFLKNLKHNFEFLNPKVDKEITDRLIDLDFIRGADNVDDKDIKAAIGKIRPIQTGLILKNNPSKFIDLMAGLGANMSALGPQHNRLIAQLLSHKDYPISNKLEYFKRNHFDSNNYRSAIGAITADQIKSISDKEFPQFIINMGSDINLLSNKALGAISASQIAHLGSIKNKQLFLEKVGYGLAGLDRSTDTAIFDLLSTKDLDLNDPKYVDAISAILPGQVGKGHQKLVQFLENIEKHRAKLKNSDIMPQLLVVEDEGIVSQALKTLLENIEKHRAKLKNSDRMPQLLVVEDEGIVSQALKTIGARIKNLNRQKVVVELANLISSPNTRLDKEVIENITPAQIAEVKPENFGQFLNNLGAYVNLLKDDTIKQISGQQASKLDTDQIRIIRHSEPKIWSEIVIKKLQHEALSQRIDVSITGATLELPDKIKLTFNSKEEALIFGSVFVEGFTVDDNKVILPEEQLEKLVAISNKLQGKIPERFNKKRSDFGNFVRVPTTPIALVAFIVGGVAAKCHSATLGGVVPARYYSKPFFSKSFFSEPFLGSIPVISQVLALVASVSLGIAKETASDSLLTGSWLRNTSRDLINQVNQKQKDLKSFEDKGPIRKFIAALHNITSFVIPVERFDFDREKIRQSELRFQAKDSKRSDFGNFVRVFTTPVALVAGIVGGVAAKCHSTPLGGIPVISQVLAFVASVSLGIAKETASDWGGMGWVRNESQDLINQVNQKQKDLQSFKDKKGFSIILPALHSIASVIPGVVSAIPHLIGRGVGNLCLAGVDSADLASKDKPGGWGYVTKAFCGLVKLVLKPTAAIFNAVGNIFDIQTTGKTILRKADSVTSNIRQELIIHASENWKGVAKEAKLTIADCDQDLLEIKSPKFEDVFGDGGSYSIISKAAVPSAKANFVKYSGWDKDGNPQTQYKIEVNSQSFQLASERLNHQLKAYLPIHIEKIHKEDWTKVGSDDVGISINDFQSMIKKGIPTQNATQITPRVIPVDGFEIEFATGKINCFEIGIDGERSKVTHNKDVFNKKLFAAVNEAVIKGKSPATTVRNANANHLALEGKQISGKWH
jgi:hypothetical protein